MHVPTASSVTTLPLTPQMPGVSDENTTGSPELAVALKPSVRVASVVAESAANVMLCAVLPPVTVIVIAAVLRTPVGFDT